MPRPVGSKNKPKEPIQLDRIELLDINKVSIKEAKENALAVLHMIAMAAWESDIPISARITACKMILDTDVLEFELAEEKKTNNSSTNVRLINW